MKYIILFLIIVSVNTHGLDDISIQENTVLVKSKDGDDFVVNTKDIKLNHTGENVKLTPPKARKLGNCLIVEYGAAWYGNMLEVGNLYLYNIAKKQHVETIKRMKLSYYFETSKKRAKNKTALAIRLNESFIEDQYLIRSDCSYNKSTAIPSMEVHDMFSRNGAVYSLGYCGPDNPQCIALHGSNGTMLFGIYNKSKQAEK